MAILFNEEETTRRLEERARCSCIPDGVCEQCGKEVCLVHNLFGGYIFCCEVCNIEFNRDNVEEK